MTLAKVFDRPSHRSDVTNVSDLTNERNMRTCTKASRDAKYTDLRRSRDLIQIGLHGRIRHVLEHGAVYTNARNSNAASYTVPRPPWPRWLPPTITHRGPLLRRNSSLVSSPAPFVPSSIIEIHCAADARNAQSERTVKPRGSHRVRTHRGRTSVAQISNARTSAVLEHSALRTSSHYCVRT